MVWQPSEVREQRLAALRARVQAEGYPTRGEMLSAWATQMGIADRTLQRDLQQLRRLGVQRLTPEQVAIPDGPLDLLREKRRMLSDIQAAKGDTRNGQAIASLIRQERDLVEEIHALERAKVDDDRAGQDFDARLEELRRDLAAMPPQARRRIRDLVLEACRG